MNHCNELFDVCPICLESTVALPMRSLGVPVVVPPCKHVHCKKCFDEMCYTATMERETPCCSLCRAPVIISLETAEKAASKATMSMTQAFNQMQAVKKLMNGLWYQSAAATRASSESANLASTRVRI